MTVQLAVEEELVLCVPRCALRPRSADPDLLALLRTVRATSEYHPRSQVEENPELLQLIPYVVVHDPDQDRFFATYRLTRGTERRLHGLYSLGVGGHINPADGREADPVEGGLLREWHEEVRAPRPLLASLCGLLWDDDSPVSLVHLGLVFWVEARAAEVSVRETEKLAGRWLSRPELERLRRRLEPWARLTLDTLPRLEARARGLGTLRVHLPGAVEAAPLQLA